MERLFNTYKFSNHDINKFILLLQKDVYSYEYRDYSEKINNISLLGKEDFYSHLNMDNITNADYAHRKRICKDFEIKNLGENLDLYVQIDTLFLADVFENFRKICLEIYELDPARYLTVPGLAWQAALKKTNVKFDLFTERYVIMLLMVEKYITGGICCAIY